MTELGRRSEPAKSEGARHGTPIATTSLAMVLRRLVSLLVPASVAVVAFLHARAIGSLVDVAPAPMSIAPFAEARAGAAADAPSGAKSASVILERNPVYHTTGRLASRSDGATAADAPWTDPSSAPPCEGVRAVASVRGEEADGSLAALDLGGRHLLRKRGGDVDDLRVVYVAADRVWLERNGALCQARVFGGVSHAAPSSPETKAAGLAQTPLEKEIAGLIARTGPNELRIDRSAVERLVEAQAELMKTPLVPEKDGERVVGFRLVRVRPGGVLATLGFETGDRLVSINGIDVTSTERMFEAYARLRTGTLERLTVHLVRGGKPTNIDFVLR